MTSIDPIAVALEFVKRINAHDVDNLCALMTEDHLFIDSEGNTGKGREHMREGWAWYLNLFPDYIVEVERTFADGNEVALTGRAKGTYAPDRKLTHENAWDIPAAWRGIIRDGLVAEWQIYADLDAVREIMRTTGGNEGREAPPS
jgi:ketosteroid isomerase-like protein